jgi:hypothetical protein
MNPVSAQQGVLLRDREEQSTCVRKTQSAPATKRTKNADLNAAPLQPYFAKIRAVPAILPDLQ